MRETFAKLRSRLEAMPPRQRRATLAGGVAGAVLLVMILAGAVYFWKLARQFPDFAQPSRLYARVPHVAPGQPLSPSEMVELLTAARYRETGEGEPLLPGTFRRQGDRVAVALRRFPTPEGAQGGYPVEVRFRGREVAEVRAGGRVSGSVALEPPLLASFYTPEMEERRPVTLDELPEHVYQAVLAAEDDAFFAHPGVSGPGILRALWANLQGGEVQQGGSTITQQLVKNVYLSQERTLSRKAKEALIAIMLEVRYGKRAILEAYLNEIYLGRSGSANLIGIGAAARAYFGKEPSSLTVEEAAVLAGMIQAPAQYLPTEHPEAAIDRRNWVLQRMGELGWVPEDQMRRSWTEPLRLAPQTVDTRPLAPYFSGVAAAEARERFDLEKLAGEGYLLFSTLDWRDQREAERAVATGLERLGKVERRKSEPLQAALLSVDPRSGEIRAYVGGRDFEVSQFDRVAQARRQAGSAFKPVVYAAAFSEGVATPASLIKDSPIVVKVDNQDWRPQNYDRRFHGMVTVRTALEQSLNIPTIRLALQVGLWQVIDVAKEMGFTGNMEPVPALALGAFEATPREMTEVYATLANGGLRPELHGLAVVLDRSGEPLEGGELESPRRVLQPHAAFLVTSMLEGVLDHGTGAGYGGKRPGSLAGKTGTTNDRRDNWFAGYSPDRVTVVWVGYDDNSRTRLSGATAALPIWSRFVQAVRPKAGYPAFVPPPGIVAAQVDPNTGQIATPYCPMAITEMFPEWQAPSEPCQRHAPGYSTAWANSGDVPVDPVTGEPLVLDGGYFSSSPYYSTEESEIDIRPSQAGDDWMTEPLPEDDGYSETPVDPQTQPYAEPEPRWRPVRPVPVRPRTIEPVEPVETTPIEPVESEDATAAPPSDGRILIRPAQRPVPPPVIPPVPTEDEPEVEPEETEEAPPPPPPPVHQGLR